MYVDSHETRINKPKSYMIEYFPCQFHLLIHFVQSSRWFKRSEAIGTMVLLCAFASPNLINYLTGRQCLPYSITRLKLIIF